MEKEIVIKPRKWVFGINLKELYHYKELFLTLALRDIKVKYKQTVIGGFWAILQPFITMVIFTFFFGNMLKVSSDGYPYAIFSYSGLLLWTYFANSVTNSSDSMIGNAAIVSKIYLPRIILPLSATLVGILDYIIAGIILFALMFYYKTGFTIYLFLVPVILFFTWMLASGLGFWFSSLNVKYRDIRYVIPFFTQLFLFITPVIYPVSVAGKFKWLLMFNPMTGLIEAHRAVVLGRAIDFRMIGISVALTIIIFITGVIYFKAVERYFADVI